MFESLALSLPEHPVVVPSISWAGSQFGALVVPDHDEMQRRATSGLGAVIDYRTLKVLSSLPTEVEVPWELMDPVIAAYVSSLSEDLVAMSESGVTSLLLSPFRDLTLVKSVRSMRAMGSFPLLGRHVRAVVAVQRKPRKLEEAMAVADQMGIGLGLKRRNEFVLAVRPQEPRSDDIVRLRLIEVVFARWLTQAAGTPATRSHALS